MAEPRLTPRDTCWGALGLIPGSPIQAIHEAFRAAGAAALARDDKLEWDRLCAAKTECLREGHIDPTVLPPYSEHPDPPWSSDVDMLSQEIGASVFRKLFKKWRHLLERNDFPEALRDALDSEIRSAFKKLSRRGEDMPLFAARALDAKEEG